jgi:hypothetical protein
MLTSGSDISAAVVAVAVVGSSHPANSGDIAASINAMHAGCARKPDIETVAPDADVDANNIRARAISTDIAFDDEEQDRASLLHCNTFRGGSMSHNAIELIAQAFLGLTGL